MEFNETLAEFRRLAEEAASESAAEATIAREKERAEAFKPIKITNERLVASMLNDGWHFALYDERHLREGLANMESFMVTEDYMLVSGIYEEILDGKSAAMTVVLMVKEEQFNILFLPRNIFGFRIMQTLHLIFSKYQEKGIKPELRRF